MKFKRDLTVDIVRSIAIILMVGANMAILSHDSAPWLFRLASSLAAPLFITLASMMVGLSYKKENSLLLSIERCFFLFIVAGLFDFMNQLIPFVNFDVLYFIGISLPIINLLGRLNNKIILFLSVIILSITPFLQFHMHYEPTVFLTLPTENFHIYWLTFLKEAPHRYLIDGWFPLFPWLSISLFGVLVGKMRYATTAIRTFAHPAFITAALLLLVVGAMLWQHFPGQQSVRYGYIELFCPPVPGFMIFAMGMALSVLIIIDYLHPRIPLLISLRPLGEASLFMYLFHIAAIDHLLLPLAGIIGFNTHYLLYYLALLATMYLLGIALEKLRTFTFYKKTPHVVRWILG